MARRKHNAAVKRKLIAKGNNNVKMDRKFGCTGDCDTGECSLYGYEE